MRLYIPELAARGVMLTPADLAAIRLDQLIRAEKALRDVATDWREAHGAERGRMRGYVRGAIVRLRVAVGEMRRGRRS